MKLMYFTDPHVRVKSPLYRLDDYGERILKKLNYVAQLGHEHNVDGYICGGDILDRPDIPYSMMAKLISVLIKFEKPIYTVIGNHEEFGYNPNSHPRTALSIVTASGLLTRLSMNNPIILTDALGNKVSLTGCDAHSELDKYGRVSDYVDIPEVTNAVRIHVVHGFLAKRPWPQVPVTTIDDILHTKAHLVLSGHEHSGFGVVRKGGKVFCNPGALGRVTASVGDVNLDVKVALIDTGVAVDSDGINIDLLKFPIEIAPPANEVIDREKLELEKEHKQAQAAFVASAKEAIKKFNFEEGFNLYSMLDFLILEDEIPEEVQKLMRYYIEKAEEELSKGGGE
ncbi:MAG: metallophosphoesterase [Herbinix sp.]|jgi:DNA repair exonuclease SbcCD nuclease subunit|nr:metallophosphoesterase [Herbinix sp.]